MNKKKRFLAPGVTTYEALLNAVGQNTPAMGIEEPLYAELAQGLCAAEVLRDYDLEDHPSGRFILARKARGENRFDPEVYDIRYLPLDMFP